jgi:tRNA dimethylallyltransferase
MEIADRIPSYLISVDSAMVYRDMNIGTAKPDAETLQRYPHALVDICDPAEAYSVAGFLRDARSELDRALGQGKMPLFVGGTMLYFKALMDGLSKLPPADPEIRAAIALRAEQSGWSALHEELTQVDPLTAAALHPNHSARIQRALEVWQQTGIPLSEWHQGDNEGGIGHLVEPVQVALLPGARAPLHLRLEQRLERMFAAGLVDEVRFLHGRSDLHRDLPAMRCVGYRQVWDYLDGDIDELAMRDAVLVATRQLAKRQTTWLRGWPDLKTIDPLDQSGFWRSPGELTRDCLKFL